ncbi:hypothetical protein GCM10028807_62770 [Spirosoma daeguense]
MTAQHIHSEPIYALGLLIQGMKYVHEEYADQIKGSSSYQGPLLSTVQKLSIICQNDINRLHRTIDKHKGNQSDEMIYTPYYEGCDLVKEIIETVMLLATVEDSRFAVKAARDMLSHVRKQIEEGAPETNQPMPQQEKMLELVLKTKWYRMIESGEKKEEYRDIKPYWWKRIFTSECPDDIIPRGVYPQRHTHVRFRLGYAKNTPTMVWKLGAIGVGNANPEWAEGHMGRMIKLPLIERIS